MKIINHPNGNREVIHYDPDGNWYCTEWKNDQGQVHREGDLPAMEFADGQKGYYVNGELHRDHNLPALEYPDGTKLYCVYGELHRTNGPAVESVDRDNEWWLNDIEYSEKEYFEILKTREKRDGQELVIGKLIFDSCNLCQGSLSCSEDNLKKFCSKCGIWG